MKQSILTGLTALVLSLFLSACRQEDPPVPLFRTADVPMEAATRSLLTAADIETKKTGVTLAAYQAGALAASAHFTSGFDAMALPLEPGKTYHVYALVNMGDRTGDLPAQETGLASMTWTIPSYTEGAESLAARGLPMAGRIDYAGQTTVIPVLRLLAKVTADLSCEWTGAAIRRVRVCNLNRVLRPFGDSEADGTWDMQEFQAGTNASSGTFTFYVPENRQGTISGIDSSLEKSPDRNAAVASRASRLTYLETVAEGTGLYTGSVTYRSYLGKDAVSDFDLCRNAHYIWTVRYLPDGLQYQDWKHENYLTDTRFLYWENHPDDQAVHVTLKAGAYGTRAGNPWRPEDLVLGDSTGQQRIQGTYISASLLLQHIGYSIDTDLFRFSTNYSDAIWFTVGDHDLPVGDYETRFFFLDRPDRFLSAWLHVRSDSSLTIDDGWDNGGESVLD